LKKYHPIDVIIDYPKKGVITRSKLKDQEANISN